jgi:hypothetical protein
VRTTLLHMSFRMSTSQQFSQMCFTMAAGRFVVVRWRLHDTETCTREGPMTMAVLVLADTHPYACMCLICPAYLHTSNNQLVRYS